MEKQSTTSDFKTYYSPDLVKIELINALCEFQKKCPEIKLDAEVEVSTKSGKYTFKYASLPNIIKTIQPILYDCGLAFTHLIGEQGVKCILMHKSGQIIESDYIKINAGTDAKGQGSAITYAKRYSLCAILGLYAEEDNDAPESPKKALSKKAFNQAKERILNDGDTKIFIQCIMHFSMSESQMNELYEASLFAFNSTES